ncbi:unnamed protein product (mitochondrion) [Plasmodiophora brassicae]|uniref:Uncharacterized protein n=1 Tax=Plasmodiophora brassicae TaxID=37360 RepID=A0A0G4J603_PLABS|nr:hypothetical protein PBRA_009256 [Plasmodiophora brassicae]SPR01532.1 unnamed protein product [Plasmodiophora brassicae]
MSIPQSDRIGIVLAPLPLMLAVAVVVVGSSVIHAVDLCSGDGRIFRDVNTVVIVEQSLTLRNVMSDIVGTDVIPLPGIAGTELALVMEFVNTGAVHGVQRAVQWAREVLSTMGLLDQCKLFEAVHYLDMPSLEAAIMTSTKRTWDEYCSMGSLLTDPSVFWAAVGHHPGMSALYRAADTPRQKRIVNQVHVALVHADEDNAMLINGGTWVDKYNVLGWAISQGEETVVELLMNVPGIDVNVCHTNQRPRRPVVLAIECGRYPGILELLLNHPGTRVADNLSDRELVSLLHWIARTGHVRMARLLPMNQYPGASVNAADRDGNTPLHRAARHGHAGVLKLFLEHPAIRVNEADRDGKTALHWAAKNGHCNATEVLLQAPGIDINPVESNRLTPLHWAAHNGHLNDGCVAALLVRAPGTEVNARDGSQWTPLHYACQRDRTRVVRILVNSANADVINARDLQGQTPLHVAVSLNRAEVVRALLQADDIDIEAEDVAHRTALRIAEEKGFHDIVLFLRQRYGQAGEDIGSSSEG